MVTQKSIPHPTPMVMRALQLHQAGRIEEACGLYKRALLVNPADAHALHFLAVLMHQTGHSAEALPPPETLVTTKMNPTTTLTQGASVLVRLKK